MNDLSYCFTLALDNNDENKATSMIDVSWAGTLAVLHPTQKCPSDLVSEIPGGPLLCGHAFYCSKTFVMVFMLSNEFEYVRVIHITPKNLNPLSN